MIYMIYGVWNAKLLILLFLILKQKREGKRISLRIVFWECREGKGCVKWDSN